MLKAKGELNPKFPGYPTLQTKLLEEEGFEVVQKRNKYFVKDFEESIIQLE